MEWLVYNGERVKLPISIERKIVRKLGKFRSEIFQELRKSNTLLVKKSLIQLGQKLKYKPYASGLSEAKEFLETCSPFIQRELLYDLIWCTEDDDSYFSIKTLNLAVECEWSPTWKSKRNLLGDAYWKLRETPYSGFKYDFQKLLLCNAELRLMIVQIANEDDLIPLNTYFNDAIQNYTLLPKGSRFLFLAFCSKEEKLFYKEITKE